MRPIEDVIELVKLIEAVKRKTADKDMVEVCDALLLRVQKEQMEARNVPAADQEVAVAAYWGGPAAKTKPWEKQGVSKATYYRKQKDKTSE